MEGVKIAKLFKKELNQKVISIIDKSKGVDQEVKIIQTHRGKFVLKKPHKEKDKILKEIIGVKECSKKGIPVPKIIFSNKNLLIESYIEGRDLDEIKTSKENFQKIYFQIGKMMRLMHSIKGKDFGQVNQFRLIGDYPSQKEAILSWAPSEIKKLEKLNYYSKEKIKKIKKYFEDNKCLLETTESVLLHSDIADYNIVIKGNKISGLIDFGDLSVGPAMQDFAFMYLEHFGNYKFKKILEGYGKTKLKEIKFYAFLWMCWLLGSKIEKKEFDKKFEMMKKRFEDIWK